MKASYRELSLKFRDADERSSEDKFVALCMLEQSNQLLILFNTQLRWLCLPFHETTLCPAESGYVLPLQAV